MVESHFCQREAGRRRLGGDQIPGAGYRDDQLGRVKHKQPNGALL